MGWAPIVIILLFYVIFLQLYTRQLYYKLIVAEEWLRVSNDRRIVSEKIYWHDLRKISFKKGKEVIISALSGKSISVKTDLVDYMAAWRDIVLQAQKHANIAIDSSLIKAVGLDVDHED